MSQPQRPTEVIIATRGSDLALYQTRLVASWLNQKSIVTSESIIKTRGDVDQRNFTQIAGDGFFTKELEYALMKDTAQLAVHSAKDLPSLTHQALPWKAVGERASARDLLIVRQKSVTRTSRGGVLVPAGFRIGTSSPRRLAQARREWPNAKVIPLRGNVPTRAKKIFTGEYDGVVLAQAGIDRLNLESELRELGADLIALDWVTAPTQGTLAVQARAEQQEILDSIANEQLHRLALAEKSALAMLGGGCHLALGFQVSTQPRGYRIRYFFNDELGDILGEVENARLGDGLRLAFDHLLRNQGGNPVGGLRVWLTSPLYQHHRLLKLAREFQHTVGFWPLIEPTSTWQLADLQELAAEKKSRALIFASPFASQIFVREMSALAPLEWFKQNRFYAVGNQTAQPFQALNISCVTTDGESSAEGLAATLSKLKLPDEPYLLIGSERSQMTAAFEKRGLPLQIMPIYETRPSQSALALDLPVFGPNDIVTFSSPSAVDVFGFHLLSRPELRSLKFAALGPSTAKALRKLGLEPIESEVSGSWSDLFQQLQNQGTT